jgi:hypothetical protein
MATKKSTEKKPLTKTAFVRSLPANMPAKLVVEKAKAVGLKLTPGYVYEIRSASKRTKRGARGAAAAKKASALVQKAGRIGADDLLRAVASEIGLSRAIAILEEQHRQVLAVLGG